MGASPQGALPCFGGFGLYRPAADVQFGTGGADFPVFGKAVGTDPVSVRMSASRMLATRTYAWAYTYIRAASRIYMRSPTHTFA